MSKELEALERYHRLDVLVENDKDLILKDDEEYKILKQALQRLEILKPLCEVVETPAKKYRYLKVRGVVVYEFKEIEEFNLFKEWLDE